MICVKFKIKIIEFAVLIRMLMMVLLFRLPYRVTNCHYTFGWFFSMPIKYFSSCTVTSICTTSGLVQYVVEASFNACINPSVKLVPNCVEDPYPGIGIRKKRGILGDSTKTPFECGTFLSANRPFDNKHTNLASNIYFYSAKKFAFGCSLSILLIYVI